MKPEGPPLPAIPNLEHDATTLDKALASEPDPWLLQDFDASKTPEFKTWESFEGPERKLGAQLQTTNFTASFMTETGPATFDALLLSKESVADEECDAGNEVPDPARYCACLLALAMGRSSLLFSWDASKNSFIKTMSRLKISGFSDETLAGVSQKCVECGNSIKLLRAVIDSTYLASPTPAKVALADVLDKLLVVIQSELGARGQRVLSVLQLQSVVKPVHSTLTYFRDLVTRLGETNSDEELLSNLFQEAQSADYRGGLIRDTVCEVLRMVSKPWVDFVAEWIGLKEEEGIILTKDAPGKGFVKIGDKIWIDDLGFELEEPDYFLAEEKMPSFLPHETAVAIFETGRNFRFIRDNHSEHPLSENKVIRASNPPQLQWEFDWDAIMQLERRAKEYEADLSAAIQKQASIEKSRKDDSDALNVVTGVYEAEFFGKSEDQITRNVLVSMAKLDQPLANLDSEDDLTTILRNSLFDSSKSSAADKEFSPHWSLLPLLSFGPIVTAQARLVNRECVKLLFDSHNLRLHLDLQKQYHLLGNGLFCSRLSHALFDPDLDAAQRQAGVALTGGNMGLRLTGRDNWPPASSELRLALMGVLAETYQPLGDVSPDVRTGRELSRSYKSELPGDLSFAVRDLSPEEIERCIDPNALEALDFLRLSYKPPAPLRPILTPLALLKYDRIFKMLLRTNRMLYVINQLFQDIYTLPASDSPATDDAILRFRIEAHHFVSQVASYFFTTVVSVSWARFEQWLDSVEADIACYEQGETEGMPPAHSPDRLREHHEQVLDDIMSGLLLRKRQAPVLKLLEDTFGLVLQFANMIRLRTLGQEAEGQPGDLYRRFRKKVELFITVCRGMGEKTGYGPNVERRGEQGNRAGPGNGIELLLLTLDLTDFYARKPPS